MRLSQNTVCTFLQIDHHQSFPRECIRKSFPVYRERQSRSRLVAHCTIYGCTKSCLDLITSHQPYISLWPSATAMESNLLYKTCNTRRAPNSSSVCLNTGLYASVTATLMPYLAYQSLCRPYPQQAQRLNGCLASVQTLPASCLLCEGEGTKQLQWLQPTAWENTVHPLRDHRPLHPSDQTRGAIKS